MKILYAEDDFLIREIVETLLIDELNASVDVASSGNEAIELLLSNSHYDVIISDLEMPRGSGLDLLQFKIVSGIKIPFFLFTNAFNPIIPFPSSEYQLIEKNDFEKLKSVVLLFRK
jgi:CheY-like chemotaxis protein